MYSSIIIDNPSEIEKIMTFLNAIFRLKLFHGAEVSTLEFDHRIIARSELIIDRPHAK